MAVIPLSPLVFPRMDVQGLLSPKDSGIDQPATPTPLPPGANALEVPEAPPLPPPVSVFDLPLVPWTKRDVVAYVEWLIQRGQPAFFITANLHYARLSARFPDVQAINKKAAFIVGDGMPLVWTARWLGHRLPERITGADLIWDLSDLAAARGYPVFLLGGASGVAELAARRLKERFRHLIIAGIEAPVLEKLDPRCEEELLQRIRASGARLLFAAFGQPKGERWIASHIESLGRVVAVQVGAAFDFAAGRIRRAPPLLQRLGLEWAFRILCDPRRLAPRYLADGVFFLNELRKTLIG